MTPTKSALAATDQPEPDKKGVMRRTSLLRQRGAAAVMIGVMIMTLVTAVTVTLDIARAYYAQRELQKLANMAAIDAARAVGGCQGDLLVGAAAQDAAMVAVTNSLAANARARVLGSTPTATVTVGTVGSDGTFRFVSPEQVDDPEDQELIAAQVNLSASSPSRLIQALASDGFTMHASGAATNSPLVTFTVRSRLFRLEPGTSSSPAVRDFSDALFGDPGFIDLLNSEDVADVDLTLAGILDVDAEVRGDALLDLDDLNAPGLAGLLEGISDALNNVNPAAAGIVDQITDILENSGLLNNPPAEPSDIFDLGPGQEAIAGLVPLNVSDILDSVSAAVLGTAPIALPVSGSLPAGLVDLDLNLQILDPPKTVIGRTGVTARAAQVQLTVNMDVDILGSLTGDIDLTLDSASARGTVESIECATSGNNGIHTVEISSQTSAATMTPSVNLAVLGVPVTGVSTGTVDITTGSNAGNFEFAGPERAGVPEPHIGDSVAWPEDLQLGAGLSNALDDLAENIEVNVLNVPLPPLLSGVLATLPVPLDNLFNQMDLLLDPLADILGLTVASAEYSVTALQVNAEGRSAVDMLIH